MSEPKPTVWGYADSEHAERYDGACDSREEAITEGRETYGEYVPIWIQGGYRPDPADMMPDAEHISDWVGEKAYDNWGGEEIVGNWPKATKESRAELDALLSTWARKHIPPTFWIGVGHAERIDPGAAIGEP